MITLTDIVEALKGVRPSGANIMLKDAVIDSRNCVPGSLFIALPGENADGHDYVEDAFRRGASLAIVHRDLPDQIPVIGLRSEDTLSDYPGLKPPMAIRVEDSLTALQDIASFWRNQHDLSVIGITGSVGKSTTKEVAAAVLEQRYPTLKNTGELEQ